MHYLTPVRRLISYVFMSVFLLFCFSSFSLYATEPTSATALVKAFHATDNSVEKRMLLSSLKNYQPAAGEKAPQWVVDLLTTALQDQSPVVVAEAAYQVGKCNAVELGTDLIDLYKNSVARFGASGYDRRVQYSVIPSLGTVGSIEAKTLIADLLKEDHGSAMGEFLLHAIKNSGDPAFINDLKLYKHKMADLAKEAQLSGSDPIFYSRKLAYIEVATEIEKALLGKGEQDE